jgi:ArsR family transcriptional regulator
MQSAEVTMRDAARFFKVLADEARLEILWLLLNHRELCVCDIMAALEITQSKASRHLSTLRHAGLVSDRKAGLWSYYALRPVEDDLARAHLELLRTGLAQRPDAAPPLARLHRWLAAKHRGAPCAPDAACATAPRSRRGTARAAAAGPRGTSPRRLSSRRA